MANSPLRSPIDVGAVIADTYLIEALIGQGGMGSVFLASHLRLPGKKVAIKLLHTDITDPDILARFRREAEIASRLGHPNIVAVHDFNVTPDGMPYLVLEFLQGTTLADRLQQGPLALPQTLSIVRQVGSALAAAHREGIVHRDLKPHNIFLVPTEIDGRIVEVAKVLDFGISKIRGSQTVKTLESSLLGTPQYMSPEQATGNHAAVDERTDVFALGAIVHEMVGGRAAFEGVSIPEVVFKVVYEPPTPLPADVPASIAAAIQHAMDKTLAGRFASVSAFVEALTGTPLTQLRPTLEPPPVTGFAAGSRHRPPADAHASTLASGDHGTIGLAETSAPGSQVVPLPPPVNGSAPTVSSVSTPSIAAEPVAPIVPAPRRRGPLLLGIGAAIAASAVVLFVVFGRSAPTKPRASRPEAVTPRPIAPSVADVKPVATPPVAIAPVALPTTPEPRTKPTANTPVARPGTPDRPGKPVTPVAPVRGEPENAELARALQEAETAFADQETERGRALVNSVINQATGRLRGRALLVRGRQRCEVSDNAGALNDYRTLKALAPRLAQKLKAACKGIL